METVFLFKNMSSGDEGALRDYVFSKLPKIEKLFQRVPQDGALLHVRAERFQKHNAYDVELTLKCGGKTFTAQEASHLITKAVDWAKDRLDMQLKKDSAFIKRTHRSVRAKNKAKFRVASPK